MLPLKISTVYIIVHYLELWIEFGCMVCRFCNRHRGFTSFFGEKAYGSVFQPRYFDRSSVSHVDRGRFATGDHTVILLNEYSAFPMFTTAEAIGRSSVCHFGFCTAQYWCAKWEFQVRVRCSIGVIHREEHRIVVSCNSDRGGLYAFLFFC